MCGRYALTVTIKDLQELLPGFEIRLEPMPRYNVAPTQVVPVAFNDERVVAPARWGLIPRWAKDASIGNRLINARAETLAEKPSFREPLKRRRCVVPVSGFYEWRKEPGSTRKTPFLIRAPGGLPIGLAGLWDTWASPEGIVRSFTIVTTEANEQVRPLHERMPVILPGEAMATWLDAAPKTPQELAPLLVPYRGALEMVQVSTAVNDPKHDAPDCVEVAGLFNNGQR